MYEELKEKALLLPKVSGVYIMEDADGSIIYIGKAKILKNRVSQYFSNLSSHSEKTLQMVRHVQDFRVVVTKTEFDALLLEAQLIKQHKPKYNILLKDDKGFPFVRLGVESYPRFTVEGKKLKDKARYFGPYNSRTNAYLASELAMNIVKLPTCSRVFPRDFKKERPCLNYHMGKCMAVCMGEVSAEEYDRLIEQACKILEGKYDGLLEDLTEQMEAAAEELRFEAAAQLRDRINVVKRLGAGQGIFSKSLIDTDVLAFASKNMRGALVKVSYLTGTLLDKETVFFDSADEADGGEVLESFIKQYYEAQGFAPKHIMVSHDISDVEALEEYLGNISGKSINIHLPQRGEKHKQLLLAMENAERELELKEKIHERTTKALEQLGEILEMPPPERIESFDISNTAGDEMVAAMIVICGGKPAKKHYKRFKVNNGQKGDDYAAMAEVVGRRLDRALNNEESFLPLPDLLLIDGGRGQVNAAKKELLKRGLAIPTYGMVKDDRHRTRELTDEKGNLLGLDKFPPLFAMITRIQDETHRFAIEYHKKLRDSKVTRSVLDNIKDVGEARKKALYKHFKTISAMKEATIEQLSVVISANAAQSVFNYFHKERDEKTIGMREEE